MTSDKLPTYFREYLDGQFQIVRDDIQRVDNKVVNVQSDVDELKKKMVESARDRLKLWIGLAVIFTLLLLHFGETSQSLIKLFFGKF